MDARSHHEFRQCQVGAGAVRSVSQETGARGVLVDAGRKAGRQADR